MQTLPASYNGEQASILRTVKPNTFQRDVCARTITIYLSAARGLLTDSTLEQVEISSINRDYKCYLTD